MQYRYTIMFKDGRKYHGCRYSKDADPSEFWVTYFTSSSEVHKLIAEHGKDSFSIIDIIEHPNDDAYSEETKFLIENDCATSDLWINKSNNDYCLGYGTDAFTKRMIEKYGVQHNSQMASVRRAWSDAMSVANKNPETIAKRKFSLMQKFGVEHQMHSDEVKSKLANTCMERYGVPNVAMASAVKEKISKAFNEKYGCHPRKLKCTEEKRVSTNKEKYGAASYSQTQECINKVKKTWYNKTEDELEAHKLASKNTRKNDPINTCPYCGKTMKGMTPYKRWHGENCKLKPEST